MAENEWSLSMILLVSIFCVSLRAESYTKNSGKAGIWVYIYICIYFSFFLLICILFTLFGNPWYYYLLGKCLILFKLKSKIKIFCEIFPWSFYFLPCRLCLFLPFSAGCLLCTSPSYLILCVLILFHMPVILYMLGFVCSFGFWSIHYPISSL